MLKNNKATIIATTLFMLIPIVIGLLLWDQLPEEIPTHWNINGEVDSWSSKAFAVFAPSCIFLALHWVCIIVSNADPGNKNYPPKMLQLVLWTCPSLNLILTSLCYTVALDQEINILIITSLLMGLMFLIIGNLLPKCRQSYTLGIKLPWTLSNEENWNQTHRFGGKVWVAGGIFIMATAFIASSELLLAVVILMVSLPTGYSYLLHRKQRTNKKGEQH